MSRKRFRNENETERNENATLHYIRCQRIINLHIKPRYPEGSILFSGIPFSVGSMATFCKLETLAPDIDDSSDAAKRFADKVAGHFFDCRQNYVDYLESIGGTHKKTTWSSYNKRWLKERLQGINYRTLPLCLSLAHAL